MDYRRVRTSEGVSDEVHFFACSRCASEISEFIMHITLFSARVSAVTTAKGTAREEGSVSYSAFGMH